MIIRKLGVFINSGTGISKAISISKTKKITASKKNRRENGKRAEFLGSNPHSNGLSFSRSEFVRVAKIHAKVKTRDGIKIASLKLNTNRSIY